MARRTKEEAEQTRKDILQAALDMFCEKGYTRTTIDDIAKSINLTKGAIYWYFRNKPDILKALMIDDFQNTQDRLESYMTEPQTPEELKQYFLFLAKMIDDEPNFRKLLYFLIFQMEWSSGLLNSFQDLFEKFRARPRNMILNILKTAQNDGRISDAVDLNMLANTFHCMWFGLMANKLRDQETVSLQQTTDFSFDFIINALRSRKD